GGRLAEISRDHDRGEHRDNQYADHDQTQDHAWPPARAGHRGRRGTAFRAEAGARRNRLAATRAAARAVGPYPDRTRPFGCLPRQAAATVAAILGERIIFAQACLTYHPLMMHSLPGLRQRVFYTPASLR